MKPVHSITIRRYFPVFILIILLGLTACKDNTSSPITLSWEFTTGESGWVGGFADYPVGEESRFELEFDFDTLPEPLNQNEGALRVSGRNLSDDLFMFVKKNITGLEPLTTYRATFIVEFASDVPDGLAGIGGSPGESVFIKAGAVDIEPQTIVDEDDYYRMNIDKGGQSQGGDAMVVIGDFSNDTDEEIYTLKTVSNDQYFEVRTDEKGTLWLIVGTDSGFEGATTIFYNAIRAELLRN